MAKKITITLSVGFIIVCFGFFLWKSQVGIFIKSKLKTGSPATEESLLKPTGEIEQLSVFSIKKDIKTGGDKIADSFPEEELGTLKNISLDNLGTHKGQWKYTYVSKGHFKVISYNPSDGNVETIANLPLPSSGEASEQKTKESFFHPDYPEIPESFLSGNLEKSLELLEKSNEYKAYREKFPDMFQNFVITVVYDEKGSWSWRFGFFSTEEENTKHLELAVIPEEEKVFVSGKNDYVK